MTDSKTLTAILAIISIFLLGAVAFGLTQIDNSNKKTLSNSIETKNPASVTYNNQKVEESKSISSLIVEASKIAEEPKKEVSATKDIAKPTDIINVANSNPEISIFASALKAADLEEYLRGNDSLTVFAPNNEAFTKYLPAETLADLQKPENKEKLVGILKGHFINTKLLSTDLQDGQYLATQQGGQLLVKITNGLYYIDNIQITKANIEAKNGIIHIIERVIPE